MGELLRRFFVVLLAIAFWGGMLERAAFGYSPDEPCLMTALSTHVAANESGHEHHHGSKQQGPLKQRDTKCFCGCIIGCSLIPTATVSEIAFQTNPISFSIVLKTYTGRSLVVDPGIPKSTA
jgi:hypothetical protein